MQPQSNFSASVPLGKRNSQMTQVSYEPSIKQVKETLREKVEDYLKTHESPIAGGKAISISKQPESLERKEERSR